MHDPMTVAFEIRWLGVTIWHVDPETDGTDNSCRWHKAGRPWWKHPKWHVHHWRISWRFLVHLKRRLFSRCSRCGRRFPWGYAPIGTWGSTGPKWFRSEAKTYHHECYQKEHER